MENCNACRPPAQGGIQILSDSKRAEEAIFFQFCRECSGQFSFLQMTLCHHDTIEEQARGNVRRDLGVDTRWLPRQRSAHVRQAADAAQSERLHSDEASLVLLLAEGANGGAALREV